MKVLTLVFLRRGDEVLLGYKKQGFGAGKWNGFGGKVEEGESIEEAARRELREEVGLNAEELKPHGTLDFHFDGDQNMLRVHVFSSSVFSGEIMESDEMRPAWYKISEIPFDSMWADDRYWLLHLLDGKSFHGAFRFKDTDLLLGYSLNVEGEVLSHMFPIFQSVPNLRYGFSERRDGNLRVPSAESNTEANRKSYIQSLGLDPMRFVSADLVHGTHVHVAREEEAGSIIRECDGLVTHIPNLALSVTGADCFPIYAVDPVERVIGLAHAGWRGITSGILPELIRQMEGLDSDVANILIGIGPGIRKCHFEIHEDIFSAFEGYGEAVIESEDKMLVDLPFIIKKQLTESGIIPSNVSDSEECTYCLKEKYFSRRREQEGELQAMMAYILLEK